MQDLDLVQLVDACRREDRLAQHALYRHFVSRVHGIALRMVGRNDADDLTQNVFLQVFRGIGSFRNDSKFETWLFRLAVNEALQYRRRNRRWPVPTLQDDGIAGSVEPPGMQGARELLELSLAELAPDLRSLFVLREVEGMSYHDLAETLDIPEGTVGSRLNRARQELRKSMLALGWEA